MTHHPSPLPARPAASTGVPVAERLFAGGGEMGALMRAHDWAATPLGPPEEWPQSLATAVRILLTSRFAMWMGWGPELTFLYNDAYGRMSLGAKHPWALGRPSREVWAEIWPDIGPRIQSVLTTGQATWDEQLLLFLERSGYPEESYHTFSYSPLADDAGVVAGLLCVVTEETERVIGERRLASLRELASGLSAAGQEEADMFAAASAVMQANPRDLPFTLAYVFDDDGGARLAAASGIAPGHPAAPARIAAGDARAPWPAGALCAPGAQRLVEDLSAWPRDGAPLPQGVADRPPTRAALVPLARQGDERPAGFLVAALNPHRPFDEAYAGFVDLVAGQLAASLANVRSYAAERQRAAALAELDRAKTTFFSNVSHEFRTPLTLMLGPAEDALADPTTRPQNRPRLELVHRNALRLLRLVNSLLDFSRIEAGRIEAVYEPTDVALLTAELASAFRSACERAGLALVVDAPPPPAGAPAVYLDHDMWEKVVLNLLSNAFKHTFTGGITVRVRAGDDGEGVTVTVEDTGIGIAPEELPRIFERFHRVPDARGRTHEGTGIGLALVQELVHRHGGTIGVASAPGRGTTFTIRLRPGTAHLPAERLGSAGAVRARATGATGATGVAPFVEEALRWLPQTTGEYAAVPAPRAPAAGTGTGTGAAARVLLADDNADMREYVARLLAAQGWDVEGVADGRAALEAARARRPDLVLSDVMMPRLDGFGLLRELRADPALRELPVILLSARAGEEARVEGVQSGADDYLVKPFAAQELVARVGAHLSLARLRHEAEATLRESEARFRNMADHAPVMLWVTEADGACSFLNREWYAFTGQTPETGLGFGWLDTVHPDDRHLASDAFLDANARRAPFRAEYRLRRADGEYRRAVDAAAPRFGDDAEFLGYIGSVLDVEERARLLDAERAARQEAEAARIEAEAANRAKSEFLAVMSHELRTPLNAIGGYAELLEMGIRGPVTEQQREDLARIQKSQQHLLGLINDVLNYARVETGTVRYSMADVPLDETIATAEALVAPQVRARGLTLHFAGCDPALTVRADAEKLRQVLLNLLTNAVKFTPPGGRITIACAVDAARARITVADTGIGVSPDKLTSIFEPFVQVNPRLTRTQDGVGLGLAISRDLARGMGGDLTVASEVGVGSTFTLTLQR